MGRRGLERPLRKQSGGLFLGRGRVLCIADASGTDVDAIQTFANGKNANESLTQICFYSTDKKDIEKQIEVIKTIKAMGAEVLMSAHVLKYIPCERVLEIALSQQERGAISPKFIKRSVVLNIA